jgi:hypothetical protein
MNPAEPENSTPHDPWQEVSWEAHEHAQLLRMAKIPFARKLEMLEEMHQMFLHMQKNPPRPVTPHQTESP